MCQGDLRWVEQPCEDMESPQCPAGFSRPPLILVSLDGFRAGYLEAYSGLLPVISKLKNCGTSTPHMRPVYPSKTFPNHYTIVTGLYPESHGIVDNKMYDVEHNASFSLRSEEKFSEKWYQGEPVWITAMRHNLRSGTFFWPGSDVVMELLQTYDRSIPFEKRIMTILEWLDLPEGTRPDFYTLYLEEPDSAGHRYGPMSSQVIEALQRVDRILGLLLDGLKQRNLHRCTNLVVLSDHGMEEASCLKAVYVSSLQDNVDDFSVVPGPAARVRPKKLPEGFYTFDYESLVKNLSCKNPAMKPYMKRNLPKRLHFANNVRIEPVHLYMKAQWQAALKPGDMKYCTGGFHGSDNQFRNMQAIFMGYGPGINSRTVVPPFESIEVFIGVPPPLTTGPGRLNPVLRRPQHSPVYPTEQSPHRLHRQRPHPHRHPGLQLPSVPREQEELLNQKLINASSDPSLKSLHLPYGAPRVLLKNARFCVLRHRDYLNGYSADLRQPLWVAYTLDRALGDAVPQWPDSGNCVRADMRIPATANQTCHEASRTMGFLHPPNLGAQSDSLLTSNMVPMYPSFIDVWAHIHNVVVQKYLGERNGVNVMSGPIFDVDYDGNYDTLDTSRICRNSSFPPQECQGPLEAVSFILPHQPDNTEACPTGSDLLWVEQWMQFHVARVRDVELLTGLSFYQDQLSITDTLQLKTYLHTF
ncbi:hypothetical protein COCON_G00099780 [Conger conger]|uniref:Uncharacterized protein n=1 Tax=Conger conger TaxID=82655 RepID=A0A9Q1DML0_CONCO|nr:hypothetical protein COCON_G00099780 [Conger conger]